MNIRAQAAQALAPVLNCQSALTAPLEKQLSKAKLRDKGLLQELCTGSLRYYHRLDLVAQQLLDKPLKKKDSDIYALVVMGLYQLNYLRVPDHAAISETVDAAKHLRKHWAAKLINAVLRNYLREREAIQARLAGNSVFEYSHPVWLIDKLKTVWPQHWQAILTGNNQQAPLSLRVNNLKTTRTAYSGQLSAGGVAHQPHRYTSTGLQLQSSVDVPSLPGFAEGCASVQDEAAQLCVPLLLLEPGMRVVDACCAPGGKSCHILEHSPTCKLLGLELEQQRLTRVEDNFIRLGLHADLLAVDANHLQSWWDGEPVERILLDAPCSATGVIRRHPDIKVLRRASDLDRLTNLQFELLVNLWRTLAPGGVLLYATCSVLPEENELVIDRFLLQCSDAICESIDVGWGLERSYGRQLFPKIDGHDGFYYCRLRKMS